MLFRNKVTSSVAPPRSKICPTTWWSLEILLFLYRNIRELRTHKATSLSVHFIQLFKMFVNVGALSCSSNAIFGKFRDVRWSTSVFLKIGGSFALHIFIHTVFISFKMCFTMYFCICGTSNNFLAITDGCCPLTIPTETACEPFYFTILDLIFSVAEQTWTWNRKNWLDCHNISTVNWYTYYDIVAMLNVS